MNEGENETDIIEEIRKKRKINAEGEEHLNDIIITQCIICIILAVAVVVLNLFYPELSAGFVERLREYSGAETEEALARIIRSVSAAMLEVCLNFT